ncbi:MAG: HYR domain-containing protein [Cyclobacteriaceae bacterium]
MKRNILRKSYQFGILFSLLLFSACGDDSKQIEVEEIDEEAPVINCPDDISLSIGPLDLEPTIEYQTPVGTDNNEAVTRLIEGLESGSVFPIGTTIITYEVTDQAGNKSSCSFEVTVTREEPTALDAPYVFGGIAPEGKKWEKVEALSDEFEGNALDDTKWHNDPSSDPFGWYGRPPALFDPENVTVADGNLNVNVLEYETPKFANGKNWTHGGAILRSKTKAGPGQFYEARIQANKTVMSTTFWIAFQQNCNTGPTRKLELDILECVGRVHDGTPTWAEKFDNIFASNTWRHQRSCDPGTADGSKQAPGKTVMSEKNHSRFFVYGCWWKSPTEMLFYLDGEFVHAIRNPPADFDIEGHITMAIETYDWNPIDDANILKTGTVEERTTKYDWVRTWKLVDE